MTAQGHEELYCSSDDAADDAGEAAGGGVVAAGGGVAAAGESSTVFLRLRNIVIGSCERCFFVDEDALINSHDVINTIAEFDGTYHVIIHFFSPFGGLWQH